MTFISDILYWISTGLLIPVIVLLILLFLRSLLLIGTFFGQYQSMRSNHREFDKIVTDVRKMNSMDQILCLIPENTKSPQLKIARKILLNEGGYAMRMKLISEYEMYAEKDLSISNILSKLGPMLGLMGTLIPMGPALVGLSTGDIASMAYNMQVAFATTVVGLFSASVGFITYHVKRRWFVYDINNLEFVSNLIDESDGQKKELS